MLNTQVATAYTTYADYQSAPSTGNKGRQMIHEKTFHGISKAFASMLHAESGHDEFRSTFETQWGTPTSLVVNMPGQLGDFQNMGSHKNSRMSTNSLHQGLAGGFCSIPQGDNCKDAVELVLAQ